jgi:hypothetical protein
VSQHYCLHAVGAVFRRSIIEVEDKQENKAWSRIQNSGVQDSRAISIFDLADGAELGFRGRNMQNKTLHAV